MLTFWGDRNPCCNGIKRRDFLRVGALGAGALGLSLADVLKLQAAPGTRLTRRGGDKAVIMVFLPGGPSHIDMYDPKPEAPKEYRGEFGAIGTKVEGIQVCDLFPMQARRMDRMAFLRAVVGSDGDHAAWQFITGYPKRSGRPAFGSVVSRLLGDPRHAMPPYVALNRMNEEDPRYLGAAHRPFTPSGPSLENLALARGVDLVRLESRRSLLSTFDTLRRDLDQTGAMEGMDAFARRAYDMIASGAVRDAFDTSKEDPRTLAAYGKDGRRFLEARRLVEAGVKVVTLSYGGWDTHGDNFSQLRKQLPVLDRALSALIDDLEQRGLYNDVAIVVYGEFGRTPKINGGAGRDHWPQVMSAVIAGGGLRMGQVIGSTDSRAERAVNRPITEERILATLYHVLGIDPDQTFVNEAGRPTHLIDDRRVIEELV